MKRSVTMTLGRLLRETPPARMTTACYLSDIHEAIRDTTTNVVCDMQQVDTVECIRHCPGAKSPRESLSLREGKKKGYKGRRR